MSWWSSSWLPSLPSIDFALSSGLQKRFISFALRQALGHLLKPGQLDIQQVDSQIGSGYVQIRDVELDNDAINSMLTGLPVELHDGAAGKMTARIPWPNPLTSTVGLSVESLHLTFNLAPTVSKEQHTTNLAESVVSVAETFIHDELNIHDENALRESIYSELDASESLDHVPGGLDPFIYDREGNREPEPSGVSIFATLVERLLARFEFDASDIKITLVHPGHSSFTLAVQSIRYHTELKGDEVPGTSTSHTIQGVTRTVQISGVSVTTRCLRPPSPQPFLSPTSSSYTFHQSQNTSRSATVTPPHSPVYSDSSDMDEETTMMMSQSILGLPPRSISPSSSVASSMYQSAISTAPMVASQVASIVHEPSTPSPPSPVAQVAPPTLNISTNEIEDETILSFGAEPITLRVAAPPPARSTHVSPTEGQKGATASTQRRSPIQPSKDEKGRSSTSEAIKIDVNVGVLAVALRARHIRGLLDMAGVWSSHSPTVDHLKTLSKADATPPAPNVLSNLEGSLRVRGVVVLLLPAQAPPEGNSYLNEFYTRPLVPPQFSHGLVRVHLENLYASSSTSPILSTTSVRGPPAFLGTTTRASFSISELSAFAFITDVSDNDNPSLRASPLLITDHNLGLQYQSQHVHPDLRQPGSSHTLPVFDVIDWTDPEKRANGVKLSSWRTRAPHGHTTSTPSTPTNKPREFASPPTARSPHPLSLGKQSSSVKSTISSHAQASALSVELTTTSIVRKSRSMREKGKGPENGMDIDVKLAPLHIFCDTALLLDETGPVLSSEALIFLEELTSVDEDDRVSPDAETSDADDSDENGEPESDSPTGTPRPRNRHPFMREHVSEREKERQRLERLVMEDLDLEIDYRQTLPESGRKSIQRVDSWRKKQTKMKKQKGPNINIILPVLRVEIRNPPKPGWSPRSGAVILDIHDLHITPGEKDDSQPTTRFADTQDAFAGDVYTPTVSKDTTVLVSVGWQRLVVAYALVGEKKAQAILSLGSLASSALPSDIPSGLKIGSPSPRNLPDIYPQPRAVVSKSTPRQSTSSPSLSTTAVAIDIPSVHVILSKSELDGLQLWADDLSQLMERLLNPKARTADSDAKTDPSLIGSRFFNKARRSQDSGTNSAASTVSAPKTDAQSETIVKVTVSEVALTLSLPRRSGVRPFNIIASDIDMLLELKPEGKDETVLTLGVMDLSILETLANNELQTFFSLTTPHSLTSTTQSLLKLRFASVVVSDSTAKESRIKVTLCGITYTLYPDLAWMEDIVSFVKAPPGVFESVVPSERTRVSVKVIDSSLRALCPTYSGAFVLYIGDLDFSTVMVGNLPEMSFHLDVQLLSLFLLDDVNLAEESNTRSNQLGNISKHSRSSGGIWKALGYALLAELSGFSLAFLKRHDVTPADMRITVDRGDLRLHLCADTATAIGAFISDFTTLFAKPAEPSTQPSRSEKGSAINVTAESMPKRDLTASLDEFAFRRTIPEVGAAPDLITDNLPSNLDYLDESFSTTAGLREFDDEDLDDFYTNDTATGDQTGVISTYGGETIRLFDPTGLHTIENYFETLPPEAVDESAEYGETTLKVRVHGCDVTVFLYDGYDWARTRKIIEEKAKEMRRRLAKIRQLVANGQTPDPTVEETNTLLFNSVYIGLEHNVDEMEPGALIAAIDEELNEELETASQSSWQSLQPQPTSPMSPESKSRRSKQKLNRSRGPSIEFRLQALFAEVDQYRSHPSLASRTLVTVRDVEILDHIKSSTWSKFLTSLHTDSKGNIRETGSNMVRFELRKVFPVPGNPAEEARLRAKILPLRLHVDQDALDFMKKFFSFKDSEAAPSAPSDPADEIFFQQAEVFPVDLKLDYKPRRVDYRALRDGRTIELMNFFHFDGAEMTLRHITLTGITGWAKVGDLLNDLWTPDVKATQLVDVISGVAPIRSVVNVGSGVADLVLLPIAQYKKDGRVVHGLQKGTTSFVKSTATEAIRLGARLATGTQVILEQAEHVIGGQFDDAVTAEAVPVSMSGEEGFGEDDEDRDLISRYADQPAGVKEGVKFAYNSLRRNLNSAAQTILAVPMEVYERSGNEGAVRAVVRAVPIAVLKPMIGASEAVSKTLLGLHNTLDPNVRTENEAKYKQR